MKKILLMTLTGEVIQPVRLNYRLISETGVIASLDKLKDVEYYDEKDLYRWLLRKNEKKFGFKFDKNIKLPDKTDIVLGNIAIRNGKLHIISNSVERAVAVIQFFDKVVPREFAILDTLDVINKIFELNEANKKEIEDLIHIFDNKKVSKKDFEFLEKELRDLKEKGMQQNELRKYAMNIFEESAKDFPEVENLPIHYYSEGIEQIKTTLEMRQIVLLKRFNGDVNYTLIDLIKSITDKSFNSLELTKITKGGKYID